MPDRYGKFASTPIGGSLAVSGGGYELATSAASANLNRVARSDFTVNSGEYGCEFVFDGTEAGPQACIGICRPSASLTTQLGNTVDGIGWRLDTGELRVNNAAVTSSLPVIGKKQLVGLLLVLTSASTARLELYQGRDLIYTYNLGAVNDWHFAVSLAATAAGGMKAYVNAGQWNLATTISRTGGWIQAETVLSPVRLSDIDYLSSGTDVPAYTRWEGNIEQSGFDVIEELTFWPWARNATRNSASGQLKVTDSSGVLDTFANYNIKGKICRMRSLDYGQALSAAIDLGWYVLDRIEILDDDSKQITLRDLHAELDEPLLRTVFLPFMSAQEAWATQPMLIGACASVPTYSVNSDGSLRWICDAPLGGVAAVTEGGDNLVLTTDWTLDVTRQQLQLVSPPVRNVIADASSIGRVDPVVGDDVWASTANPFTGTNGLTPSGMTANSSGGMGSPVYNSAAYTGSTLGGVGKFPYQSGAVFANGPVGGSSWISRSATTVASGASVQYRIQAVVGTKLLLSWSTDPKDAVVTMTLFGYFEGTITNPYATAKPLYLIAIGTGTGGNAAVVTSAIFSALQQSGADLLPAKLERAVADIMGRCKKANWKNEELAAIDTATAYAGIGFWSREKNITARSVLPDLLENYAVAVYGAKDGQLRFVRMEDPATLTVALDMTLNDLDKVIVLPDDAVALTSRMAYRPNWSPLSNSDFVSDLLDVPVSKRLELMAKHRGVVYSSVDVSARYRLSDAQEPMESLFWRVQDAQAELDRIRTIYAVDRNFYHVVLKNDRDFNKNLGSCIRLTYSRYGLAAGKKLMLVSRRSNATTGDHLLTLWG